MPIIIKTPEQVDGIRKSCQLAAKCLRFIEPEVKAGVTTAYLDKLIEQFIYDNNGVPATLNYKSPGTIIPYPKSTCISLNEVVCHGIPSEHVILKDGDILNIDVTTILNGYFGDTSTMFSVGEISNDAKDLLAITKKCLEIGIKQVFPGNYFGNIGYEIAKYAMLQRVEVVDSFCGHGVGIKFHEEPAVLHIAEKNSGPKMEPNMIFTCEPMINLGTKNIVIDSDLWTARTEDNLLSAQYEHTILVTECGYEILT